MKGKVWHVASDYVEAVKFSASDSRECKHFFETVIPNRPSYCSGVVDDCPCWCRNYRDVDVTVNVVIRMKQSVDENFRESLRAFRGQSGSKARQNFSV